MSDELIHLTPAALESMLAAATARAERAEAALAEAQNKIAELDRALDAAELEAHVASEACRAFRDAHAQLVEGRLAATGGLITQSPILESETGCALAIPAALDSTQPDTPAPGRSGVNLIDDVLAVDLVGPWLADDRSEEKP